MFTLGGIVLGAIIVWLAGYFSARGFDLPALRASFGSEIGYWAPVLVLCVPGLLLVFHGRRMLRNAPISLLAIVEVAALLAVVVVIALLVWQSEG